MFDRGLTRDVERKGCRCAQPLWRQDGDRRSMIAAENISAILLAAGGSLRFGTSDKLLAPVAGAPLALHAAARIMELAPGRRIAVCPDGDGPLARRLAAQGFDKIGRASCRERGWQYV